MPTKKGYEEGKLNEANADYYITCQQGLADGKVQGQQEGRSKGYGEGYEDGKQAMLNKPLPKTPKKTLNSN
jgi:flagellar biosynthesis/type III secretory pathway protein FliH